MNAYTFTQNGFTFKRIPKDRARAAYNNGLELMFCPCNLRPGFPWFPEARITPYPGETFDHAVSVFESYNCTDRESGKYTAFYVPVCSDSWDGHERYDYSFMEGGKERG